jgi:hypothetical protein
MNKINKILSGKAVAAFRKDTVGTLCMSVMSLFIMSTGCTKKEKEKEPILGTKWKLVGIVDVQTGELKELEPKDCEECYTLTFLSNTTAEGRSCAMEIKLDLSCLGSYRRTNIGEAYTADNKSCTDGNKFREALYTPNTKSYVITATELKFINDVENYYLLFKLIEP